MPSRTQVARYTATGARPGASSLLPGTLYVNFADRVIGMINAGGQPVDLQPIRTFSTTADYAAGAMVVHNAQILRAKAPVTAGAFDATEWVRIDGQYITVSDTEPTSPVDDAIWIDTSGMFPVLKYYDSGWQEISGSGTGVTLVAFDSGTDYAAGQFVTEAGSIWLAPAPVTAGPFDAADWVEISDAFLPLVGGVLSGALRFSHPNNLATREGAVQRSETALSLEFADIDGGRAILSGLILQGNDVLMQGTGVGTATPAAKSVVSRERGDLRYVQAGGGTDMTGDQAVEKASYPWSLSVKNATQTFVTIQADDVPDYQVRISDPSTGDLLTTLLQTNDDLRFDTNTAGGVFPTSNILPSSLMTRARADALYQRNPLRAEVYDPGGNTVVEILVTSENEDEDVDILIRDLSFAGTVIPNQSITIPAGSDVNTSAGLIATTLNNLIEGPITLQAIAVANKASVTTTGGAVSDGTTFITVPPSIFVLRDGSTPMTGTLNMSGAGQITNLLPGINGSDAIRKDQAQPVNANLTSLAALSEITSLLNLQNFSQLPVRGVTNFDTAILPCSFYAPSSATNGPVDLSGSAKLGFISRQTTNDVLQVVFGQSITRMYYRLLNAGVWSSWERVMRFSDVLNQNDFATGDPDRPPSQLSTRNYVGKAFIRTDVISSDAVLDLTLDTSRFRSFELELTNVIPATDGARMIMRLSNDGGSTFEEGASAYKTALTGETPFTGNGFYPQFSGDLGSAAGEPGLSGTFKIHNPGAASSKTFIQSNLAFVTVSNIFVQRTSAGLFDTPEAHDAIRILFDNGDLESGEVTLFGVR